MDLKMGICHRRDLRQMGDTDHLMALCNIGKFLGNLLGCPSADTCIDLIKNKGWDIIGICKNGFDRQHDT